MQNQKFTFAKEGGVIKAWKGERREDMPEVIIDIDLDDEDMQAEFFKQFMRERLMKSGSEEGLDIRQCEKVEAVGIIKEIELTGEKIADNDTEAEAIFEYIIANQIHEYKSEKVILLDDLAGLKGANHSRWSRWLLFFDIAVEIIKEGKEKTEAIKKAYVKTLEKIESAKLSYLSGIKAYLDAISRVESKYREGEIAKDEYEAFKQAEEEIKAAEQRERNLKRLITEIAKRFRPFEQYLEDADYVISILSHAKNDLRVLLEMRSVEETKAFEKIIQEIGNAVRTHQ